YSLFFFFTDTATTEIYTLSLHDALPILNNLITMHPRLQEAYELKNELDRWFKESDERTAKEGFEACLKKMQTSSIEAFHRVSMTDRKSTRLNSSHVKISYAVFCLKKKKK